ncbi:MAG TPA: PucR family transcriptional regulator, partial [Vicinamibacteria bacterium]|nr:PucR family transcriptional regulator [Vicinamibacteria bacterium]
LTPPDPLPALEDAAAAAGLSVLPVSAHTGEGLADLRRRLLAAVRSAEPVAAAAAEAAGRGSLE